MSEPSSQQLWAWLAQSNQGDVGARDRLLEHTYRRLLGLARRIINDFPQVRQFEGSTDVLQNAQLRLCSALAAQKPPTLADFFRLSAALIRRELVSLTRHYFGPEGEGANRAPGPATAGGDSAPALDPPASSPGPASWAEREDSLRRLHEHIDALPDEERQVVDLLYYQELTQDEAAQVAGVSLATLKRRWASARLRLGKLLHAEA